MELNELEILDTAFKEVTKKVAKIEMYNIDLAIFDNKNSNSIIITTNGEHKITIVFYASINVMQAITENMKRGKISDISEIDIYVKEYFNIFCGRVITIMNNITKKSVRFSVPNFINGIYLDNVAQEGLDIKELYYKSDYGPAKVQTIYQSPI